MNFRPLERSDYISIAAAIISGVSAWSSIDSASSARSSLELNEQLNSPIVAWSIVRESERVIRVEAAVQNSARTQIHITGMRLTEPQPSHLAPDLSIYKTLSPEMRRNLGNKITPTNEYNEYISPGKSAQITAYVILGDDEAAPDHPLVDIDLELSSSIASMSCLTCKLSRRL